MCALPKEAAEVGAAAAAAALLRLSWFLSQQAGRLSYLSEENLLLLPRLPKYEQPFGPPFSSTNEQKSTAAALTSSGLNLY